MHKGVKKQREGFMKRLVTTPTEPRPRDTLAEDSPEESEEDGLTSDGDVMFPPQLPEDDSESEDWTRIFAS
jgi:hypothetical protein